MSGSIPYVLRQVGKLYEAAPERVEATLRAQPELWRQIVVGAYLDDEISLAKAAELLDMPSLALRAEFARQGLPIKLGSTTVAEAVAEVQALQDSPRQAS